MNPHRKKQELEFVIRSTLSPLIDNDYLFLDLPYHNNLGDSLIWQGTEDFLSSLPYKCLIRSSYNSNEYVNIATDNPDSVILLHGGGNFGDLWPMFQKFRKTVITQFPGRKILILPQTIHYNDNLNLEADSVFFFEIS